MVLDVILLLAGFSLLAGGPKPGSLEQSVSPALLVVWALALIATGGGLLFAAFWPDAVLASLVEGFACFIGFLTTAAYVAAVADLLNRKAFVLPVLLTAGYGIGCLVRALQIRREMKAMRRVLRQTANGD